MTCHAVIKWSGNKVFENSIVLKTPTIAKWFHYNLFLHDTKPELQTAPADMRIPNTSTLRALWPE